MPAGPKNDAIDKWITSGLRYVELPTGTAMRIRIPSAERMLRANVMPTDLREMAVKFATTGIALEAMDADGLDAFLQMKQIMVADCIREIYGGEKVDQEEREQDADGWQAVTITAADLDEFEIDPDDLSALSSIVMRQATVNMITAASRREHGRLDPALAAEIEQMEGGDTLPAWGDFREERRGADRGTDGGAMAEAPVEDAQDPRAGSRVRARRGARA
jgi:hypothetical protein